MCIRDSLRVEPDPQEGRKLVPTVGIPHGGAVTPPDPDNPPPVGMGSSEWYGEPTAIGGWTRPLIDELTHRAIITT